VVDKEIVMDTIKKMYQSGIEDDVIEQTLRDIGLTEEKVKAYISEAKGLVPETGSAREPKPLATRMMAAEEKVDHSAMHETTHIALEGQSSKLSELIEKIEGLEKKLSAMPTMEQNMPQDLVSINQRLATIDKHISGLKAEIGATRLIMEKILETDRKVLNRL